jgi:glutathione-specific gamma-glutamylcyclotransferase
VSGNDSHLGRSHWVFGYGSLMWRPGFDYLRCLPATLKGYHRRLCIYSHQYRGTPDKPGLVFGLDRGGSCNGVVFEVAGAQWPETLAYLREREQLNEVYAEVRKSVVATGMDRPVEALTFIVRRAHTQYAGHISDEEIFRLVEQGHGQFGACRDYVENTLQHLRGLDICDQRLERLCAWLEKGLRNKSLREGG